MGNVGESQNMDMVIDAVSLIKDISGYKIHIVGEGSMYNHSVERVQKEGLTEKIVFTEENHIVKCQIFIRRQMLVY